MILKKFTAEGFRNIEKCEIDFSDGANLLLGGNAEGKTNVIEGIYLFSRGRSFRTADDGDLVSFGKEGFRISVEYEGKDGLAKLEYAHFGRQRLRKKNGYKLSGITEMLGNFRSVLFFPDDLRLVKGEPEERRAFLNVAISQSELTYLSDYKSFKCSLENRNALLKRASRGEYIDRNELISWGEVMAEHSASIYFARKKYIAALEGYAAAHVAQLSGGKEKLTLSYKCDIPLDISDKKLARDEYVRVYTEKLEREMIVGTSLGGPQRDDLLIEINGTPARSFASQGQQRSVVLGLKLAEGEVIRERFGEYPVFLFDDVLSELDLDRRAYVSGKIAGMQTIMTSCEDDSSLGDDTKVINVKGGSYVPAHR